MSKKEDYKQANLKFLEDFSKGEGVKALPGGVLYRVIENGDGISPSATSVVSVYYKGQLINGVIFDSNLTQPCPEPFRLNEVIKGWQIALPQMKVGDKWEIVIPANLAYGSRGVDGIPRNSTLIFEIALVNVF